MRKALKWIGTILAGLFGLIILALGVIYFITEAQLNKTYAVSVKPVAIPTGNPAAIERGRHLVTTVGFCADCHGKGLAGQTFDDGPLIGRLSVPNLTPGRGGISPSFTDADWVRAIRHGLGQDNKSLVDMPSNYYYTLTDADLGAVIAYLKSLSPIDHEVPETTLGPVVRIFLLQNPSLLPAQVIDHTGPRPAEPEIGATTEYGQYLATFCKVCHSPDLSGGAEVGAGLNLTPGGNLADWSEADFIRTLRTGVTPQGRELDPKLMPWSAVGKLSDDELKAIWLYLQSLPPVETESS
jgi:mono/diheme cytochrome c family protein